ncbi:VWA domain-containing protein [Archangium lansingense]|uniref:VWA domain-containing protein n=1 Tax=Archangium lansingense TaxID=2995310 RepID=UPI003B8096C0
MSHFARWLLASILLVSSPVPVLAQPESCCTTNTDDDDLSYEESFHPCREDDRGKELEHRVEARIEGDLAHLTVHRTFHNASQRYTELYDWLELPLDATVHGFALESQGSWTEGTLLAASEAGRRYAVLRRKGTAAPRTSARLSAAGDGADLHLWNLPPGASVTVRYDLRIRLGYTRGHSFFSYPLTERESQPFKPCGGTDPRPVLTVAPPYPGAEVHIREARNQIARDALEASWPAKPFHGIDARAGFAPGGTGTVGFLQLRVGRLSEAPTRARVVFVMDASHSMGEELMTHQIALAREYLQHLPDATAEVVVFRRSAERLFGRLIPASEWETAVAALPAARLAPGNGSHLDEGLKLAQQVLQEGSGPARIIVLTDGLLRRAFDPLPPSPVTSAPDAAVHLQLLHGRVDHAPTHSRLNEPLVQKSCGLQLRPLELSMEALVRPMAWQKVHLENEQGTWLKEWKSLEEGQGVQLWLPSPQTTPGGLVLRGRSWGCTFTTLPVELDPAISNDLGRNAEGWSATRFRNWSEEDRPPAPEVVELLAKHGDWLSPARSFLAIPTGAGPSSARTRALPARRKGEGEGIAMGVVSGSLCDIRPWSIRKASPEFAEELTRLLQPALTACLGNGSKPSLQVRVETTGDEIVEVEVTGAASEAQATCVREATWALRLPALFDDGLAEAYTLTPLP